MSSPKPKSILSLDVGHKRIGLAGCDPLGITIKALPAILRGTFDQDLQTFQTYCQIRNVEGLVVGLPLDEEGKQTRQSIHCKRYGHRIAKALELPVAWVNEHSSTWTAGEVHKLQQDRTGKLDSESAALLLAQWLEEGPELKPVHVAAYSTTEVVLDARS